MIDPSQLANICWDYMSERPDVKAKLSLYNDLIGFQGKEFNEFIAELGKRIFCLGVSSTEDPDAQAQHFINGLKELRRNANRDYGGLPVEFKYGQPVDDPITDSVPADLP